MSFDAGRSAARRGTTLAAAMLGLGSQSMSTMLLSYVLTTLIAEFGLSGAAGGLISTVTNIGMLIGGIIFGTLADRCGRTRVFAATVALFSLATGLGAISSSVNMLYLFRFLVGVGAGGEYGVVMSMIADAYSREQRGRITSYVTVSGQIGSIIAAIAAALIVPVLGWRGLFAFGALPVLLAIWARFALREGDAWKRAIGTAEGRPSIRDLFSRGRATTTIRLTIMATAQVAGYFGLMNWLPAILQGRLNLSVSGSSLWMIATITGMSIGMIVFGQIMDRLGAKVAYGLFLIASAIAVFAYSFAGSAAVMLIGGALVGFFCNGMNAGYGAIVGNLYPVEIRATANNTIFNIGRAVGGFSSVVIGFLLESFSLRAAMAFLAIMYIISLFCVLTLNMTKAKTGSSTEQELS
ncbi:major facilitator superfamily MFS_1 [Coriobacterium glomerans PW2]|uniref:Major facilitator superfamily MFS_1 n=1 Tax=Coriobacterium glomerans (strain ATCC 49209 / DSM 20642 / JCM 10262 / PW2) TaxID=700015 RepID=F2N9N1_CORGP|nr:MFS transporter [Coriobacterium glomerans]AEB07134.1 major facilitator superfamily MFS_1 [Coriobacterium glomerans PW2]